MPVRRKNRDMRFQSTLSMRRATPGVILKTLLDEFQSTLSMRRATSDGARAIVRLADFNPRSP